MKITLDEIDPKALEPKFPPELFLTDKFIRGMTFEGWVPHEFEVAGVIARSVPSQKALKIVYTKVGIETCPDREAADGGTIPKEPYHEYWKENRSHLVIVQWRRE